MVTVVNTYRGFFSMECFSCSESDVGVGGREAGLGRDGQPKRAGGFPCFEIEIYQLGLLI